LIFPYTAEKGFDFYSGSTLYAYTVFNIRKGGETVKSNKLIIFGSPVLYLVLGVILLLFSETALGVIGYVVAAAMALVGIVSLVSYLSRPAEQNVDSNGFSFGLVMLILGVATFLNNASIAEVLPVSLGFFIALNGVRELQNSVDAYRLKISNSWIVTVVAIVNLLLGIVLMANPFSAVTALLTALGVGLVVSGAADLITTIVVAVKSHSNIREQNAAETVSRESVDDNIKES